METVIDEPKTEEQAAESTPHDPVGCEECAAILATEPAILDWEHNEDGDSFFANSSLRHPQDRGSDEEVSRDAYGPLVWQIDHVDEKWAIFESHSELTGIPDNQPKPEFDTLAEAKSWCEAREKELTAPKADAPVAEGTPEAQSVEPPSPEQVYASRQRIADAIPEKVGSRNIAAAINDWHDRLMFQRRCVRNSQSNVDSISEELKGAKKDLERDTDRLLAIIDEQGEPNLFTKLPAPIFDKPAETVPRESVIPEVPAPLIELVAEIPAEDESWRLVPLSTLTPKIGNRALKSLASHAPALTTLGELGDWQAKKSDFWAQDIKGLGNKGKSEIEEAQMGYWSANPRQSKPVASESEISASAK
ncbi:MAG TPA: hypothetical protein VGM05_22070 [Planctomycetaceae bacterium]